MIRHDKMQAIGAVGNKGALYTCEKVFGYAQSAAEEWFEFLERKYPQYRDATQPEQALRQRRQFAEELRKDGAKYGFSFSA